MFSVACPNISRFATSSPVSSISVITRFAYFKHLEFTGRTLSTPDETLSTLRSLQSLTSLNLSEDVMEVYYPPNGSQISLTLEVLAQMNPLTEFRIHQNGPWKRYNYETSRVAINPESWHIFTIPMIKSLRMHIPSLRSLCVFSQHAAPPREFLLELLRFVSSSQLTSLFIYSKIPSRIRNSKFGSFLPRVAPNRMASQAQVIVRGYNHHFKLLRIHWETVPRPHGHDMASEEDPDLVDRAELLLESESES